MSRTVDPWGEVQFSADDAVELLMQGYPITAVAIRPDASVAQYNQACSGHNKDAHRIAPLSPRSDSPAEDTRARQAQWAIPAEYAQLDVRALLLARCQRPDEIARVEAEMTLFEAKDMVPVLRLMAFLVARWRHHGVVWGVGRGSSVASYCLFLLGVHHIDSLHYDLSITEFLRDDVTDHV